MFREVKRGSKEFYEIFECRLVRRGSKVQDRCDRKENEEFVCSNKEGILVT